MVLNIFIIYISYVSVIALIERYEGSLYLTVTITWFANFLMPFAFGAFVQLRFNMLEILEIIHFVSNTLFYFVPVIFLLATFFSAMIFILPHKYEYYSIMGIKAYLGAVALVCCVFLVRKMIIELFCDEGEDVTLLYDFQREKQKNSTKNVNENDKAEIKKEDSSREKVGTSNNNLVVA